MSSPDIDQEESVRISVQEYDSSRSMEDKFHDYEIEVTPSQHEVITHPVDTNTTLQVIAGPGSGKTTTLVYKIAYMIGNLGIHPSEILILSMTNKAVEALQTRLAEIYGENVMVDVTTFHGFAHRCVIKTEESRSNGIQIIEEAGWRTLIQLIDGHSKVNKYTLSKLIDAFKKEGSQSEAVKTLCKSARIDLDDLKDVIKTLDTSNVLVHSDVMIRAKNHVKEGRIPLPYKVVIVDEFQDVYPEIYELVQLVSQNSHLIVAGDPHQSIYGFLGSNDVVKTLFAKFKPIYTLFLNESFRSTPEIIEASNTVVKRETPSVAFKDITGFKPVTKLFKEPTDQYEWVTKEIIRLMKESEGIIEPSDIAILARTNNELLSIKHVLNFYGVLDFRLTSNPSWLSEGLFHLLDYLRIICSPETSNFPIICTLNLLKGIGPAKVKALHRGALEEQISLYDYMYHQKDKDKLKPAKLGAYLNTIEHVRKKIDLDDPESIFHNLLYLANELGLKESLAKTIDSPAEKEKIINQLLDFYENLKLSKSYKNDEVCLADHFLGHYIEVLPIARTKRSVKLSTIHAAKGLEFPIVFILGAHQSIVKKSKDEENLLYVAMTRAKTMLYLSTVQSEFFDQSFYDRKFPSNYYTNQVPKIKGSFTAGFAKEFHRPLGATMPKVNMVRSFHTVSRAFKRL